MIKFENDRLDNHDGTNADDNDSENFCEKEYVTTNCHGTMEKIQDGTRDTLFVTKIEDNESFFGARLVDSRVVSTGTNIIEVHLRIGCCDEENIFLQEMYQKNLKIDHAHFR